MTDPVAPTASTDRLAAMVGLLGTVALAVSAFLPWVAGPDRATVTYGWGNSGDSVVLGAPYGLSGGDGVLILGLAAVAVAPIGMGLLGHRRRAQRSLLVGVGALALAWVVLDAAEMGRIAGDDG